jgi:hypothetical protein
MTDIVKNEARNILRNNFEYLDEVIEAAIINLLEDENIDCEQEFILELQYAYDTYVGREKYGKQPN